MLILSIDRIMKVVTSAAGTDEVIVQIGTNSDLDEEFIIKDLKDRFRSKLRVAPIVEILPIDTIQQINFPAKCRKPIKFIDDRTH